MSMSFTKLLGNPRLVAILFLGFASGLPLALIGSTLQAWFTEENIDLVTIGSLSLLGIPYTLKFLWAPLMDYFRIPVLGRRRGWILLTQVGVAALLLTLSFLRPSSQAHLMGMAAFLLAVFSASQDIAIDAYRTDILKTEERGLGAAYFVFTYRIAILFSGGLALVFADHLGWKLTYQLMAVLIVLSMAPAWMAPKVADIAPSSQTFFSVTLASIKDLFTREKVVLLLLFIVFYKIGDALALQLMTNFLLHGLGFSLSEVGLAYKTVSFIATVGGAFIGGLLLVRWNIFRALLVFGLAQAFSNLMFVALAWAGKNYFLMIASIFIENFCSGLSTAAFFAFLMSLCNHRYTASQYALLSAIASLGRVFLGPVAGVMVKEWGWIQFYIWSFLLCFPGLIFLLLLKLLFKEKVLNYAPADAN